MTEQRTIICRKCGKTFQGFYRQRFCPKCEEKMLNDIGKPFNVCMNCGFTFKARLGAKYCSNACRQMAHRKNKHGVNVTKVTEQTKIESQLPNVTSVTNQLTPEEWNEVRELIWNLSDITWKHSQNMANSFKNDYLLNESEGKSKETLDKEAHEIYNYWFKKCHDDSVVRVAKLRDYLIKLGMPEK